MRKTILLIIIFSLFAIETYGQRIPLQNGKPVQVCITQFITSYDDIGYQHALAIIADDVRDNSGEYTLIKAGTPVRISIQKGKARGLGKAGYIDISYISTIAIDGQAISLYGSNRVTGRNREDSAIACGVILGVLIFPIGALGLCIKGTDATIPSGTIFSNINIYGDYMIQIQ